MFIILIRTLILYFIVVFSMRMMGKRQIGELQPFELVITIMISDLASLPMQDTRIPIINGIIPIITMLILQITLSILQLKNEKARKFICGKPSILIQNGEINVDHLKYERFNINDLLEELRLQGYYNLDDIKYAILETSGQLSIIPKSELSQVTRQDLNLQCEQELLPVALIMDGKISEDSLRMIDKNYAWLEEKLKENNISSPQKIFIAILDSKGKFYFQYKEGENRA